MHQPDVDRQSNFGCHEGIHAPGYEETWSKVLDIRSRPVRADAGRVPQRHVQVDLLLKKLTNTLLENPDMVKIGGEKRSVTIMMSDLRGFTALADRLEPEQVVQILNTYFEVMVDVLLKYNATINEIIGDSLLVIFGAPQEMPDRAERAVACAIEMQNAMTKVNEQNRSQGLPEIEMGIGLNEVEAIVGNIGSSKRSKYGVVGSRREHDQPNRIVYGRRADPDIGLSQKAKRRYPADRWAAGRHPQGV